jgi:hypothetical protein
LSVSEKPIYLATETSKLMNPDFPSINEAGEKLVEQWLTENGYTNIQREPLMLNEQGLKASGPLKNILVQIRTFLHPNRPFKMSDYELDILTRRAAKLELVAYVAYVVLDNNGALCEEIHWERLS